MHGRIPVRRSRAAGWSRILGALAVPVLALDVLGAKVGFVPREAIVPAVLLSFALGIAACLVAAYALTDIWSSGALGAGSAFAGVIYTLPVLAVLGVITSLAIVYPRLNDISTDLNDPPAFSGRPIADSNGPDEDSAALQTQAYPDLAARLYDTSLENVYTAVQGLVDERGWTVTREVPPPSMAKPDAPSGAAAKGNAPDAALDAKSVMTQSRSEVVGPSASNQDAADEPPAPADSTDDQTALIQAMARTPLLGFIDDIVVRLQPGAGGVTVDMRSASEFGLHDLGQNARRVRNFLADLDTALQPPAAANGTVTSGGAAPPQAR